MALQPYAIIGDFAVILSLDVTAAGDVVGYSVDNRTDGPVVIDLASGGAKVLASQSFPVGVTSGTIPRQRQWNINDETSTASYSVTVRW